MKRPREVEDTSLFDQILGETPLDEKIFVSTSLDIAHQIINLMEKKQMKSLKKSLSSFMMTALCLMMLSGCTMFQFQPQEKFPEVPSLLMEEPPTLKCLSCLPQSTKTTERTTK